MKKMFPGYYLPSEEDYEALWREGVFVFDTNALLNMYDYPDRSREVFFDVLKKMQNRIWIPFFVGIEFHRNRFNRISQSSKRVNDLLDKIQKTAHNLIDEVSKVELEKRAIGLSDIQERLTAFSEAHSRLSEAVRLACDNMPLISLNDGIAERIGLLFDGKVGSPPASQSELNRMAEEAKERYEKEIPPGFCDKNKNGSFRWAGIEYKQEYGDFFVWNELVEYVSKNSIKNVVFVTGDKKKDWWLIVDGKTMGPHPCLVEEIQRVAGAHRYWMYRPDGFLEYADKYLSGADVAQDVIKQVAGVVSASDLAINNEVRIDGVESRGVQEIEGSCDGASLQRGLLDIASSDLCKTVSRQIDFEQAVFAVVDWIEINYDVENTELNATFPEITISVNSELIGFCVKFINRFALGVLPVGADSAALRGFFEVNRGKLNSFVLVVVLSEYQYNQFREVINLNNARSEVKEFVAKYKVGAVIYGYIVKGVFYEFLTVK